MSQFYGEKDRDRLDSDPDEVVVRLMEDEDYNDFPIQVYVFETVSIKGMEDSIATRVLEDMLESIDCEYGDPDGDNAEPTEKMREAAIVLANTIITDYQPWVCEETGEILKYSKEEAEKIAGITKEIT